MQHGADSDAGCTGGNLRVQVPGTSMQVRLLQQLVYADDLQDWVKVLPGLACVCAPKSALPNGEPCLHTSGVKECPAWKVVSHTSMQHHICRTMAWVKPHIDAASHLLHYGMGIKVHRGMYLGSKTA